jgi:RHS repeat-associated protein
VVTSATGTVIARRDYRPFGEEIVPSTGDPRLGAAGYSTDTGTTVRFTSQQRDTETGLDYFGARYFSNPQGRFMTPNSPLTDQDSSDPQTWNLFGYVRNNPLIFIDPTGEDCIYTDTYNSVTSTVAVEQGTCSHNGGTYVAGRIEDITYDERSGSLAYNCTDYNGMASIGSTDLPDPGLQTLQQAGQMAGPVADPRFISTFYGASIIGGTAYAGYELYAGAASLVRLSSYVPRIAAALAAAQRALKQLPPDQFRLLQQWLGPIKAGSPITPPPPGLSAEAMQRYLDVAKLYVSNGGSGAAIQAARIAALESALGKH